MAKNVLRKLSINRVALVARGSNPEAEIMLFKSFKEDTSPQPGEKEFTDMKIDSTKYTKEERESLVALLAKGGVTVEEEKTPTVPDEILKTLSPEVLAIITKANATAEAATASAAAAIEKANQAEAIASLEKSAREETEFVGSNLELVKSFPGTADASARVLHRVKKAVKPEDYAALETLIKAGNAALAKATTETGHSEPGTVDNAYRELDKLAKAKVTSDKMSYAKAFDVVCDEHPELVAQYREERGTSARQ